MAAELVAENGRGAEVSEKIEYAIVGDVKGVVGGTTCVSAPAYAPCSS